MWNSYPSTLTFFFAVSTLPAIIPQEKTEKNSTRTPRQLFYNQPNVLLVPGYGFEGGKCMTARGIPGVCVRFNACRQYYRITDTLGYLALRQWPRSDMELCSFFDLYGRANSGICCSLEINQGNYVNTGNYGLLPWGNGLGGPTLVIPAPLPAPPVSQPEEDKGTEPAAEEEDKNETSDENFEIPKEEIDNAEEGEVIELPDSEKSQGAVSNDEEQEVVEAMQNEMDNSPDFVDENNLDMEPVNKGNANKIPVAVTYDDYRYQWPQQFFGSPFSGVSQWPPPIPTHPSSPSSWPPPIPTHPPNHHYPTHPPVSSSPGYTTKRPSTSTTTRRTTTTTKRPSYPSYPQYPTHKPAATTMATTTTRRPASSAGGSNSLGLPTQCGIKNPVSPDQERIVGGTNASPNEFPWIAVLFKSGKQFCGGSLITNQHILTAAHCVAR